MKEITKIEDDCRKTFEVHKLTPEFGRFPDPHANICQGKRAFFNPEHVRPDDYELMCACFPIYSASSVQNYRAIPFSELELTYGIQTLNLYLNIGEENEQFNDATEIMGFVLDALRYYRPDRILGAESKIATDDTLEFLAGEGYSLGDPRLKPGSICYLGAFKNPSGRIKAIGVNGVVFLDNADESFAGPIYVLKRKKGYGDRTLYSGVAMHAVDGILKEDLTERCLECAPTIDIRLNRLVLHVLNRRI